MTENHLEFGLISPTGSAYSNSQNFLIDAEALDQWYRARLDISGGWLDVIEQAYFTRTLGLYRLSVEHSDELRRIGHMVGSIYKKVGLLMLKDKSVRRHFQDRMSAAEQEVLSLFPSPPHWATTLRADVILSNDGIGQIVEINTDNVAGVEDVLIHLLFFRNRCTPALQANIDKAIQELLDGLRLMIRTHWADFLKQRDMTSPSDTPYVCIAYQDRDDSFFLARFLADAVRAIGIPAHVRRPEHLTVGVDGYLYAEDSFGNLAKVDILLKHWLCFEMYSAPPRVRLLDQFRPLIEAAANLKVLVLNPLNDRLLFSKELLAFVRDPENAELLELSSEERNFVATRVVRTTVLDNDEVLKQADSFGGRDVIIPDAKQQVWLRQPLVKAPKLQSFYRQTSGDPPTSAELNVVHGVLVHNGASGPPHVSGIMTRLGPDPVVNWCRGAQLVAALLTPK